MKIPKIPTVSTCQHQFKVSGNLDILSIQILDHVVERFIKKPRNWQYFLRVGCLNCYGPNLSVHSHLYNDNYRQRFLIIFFDHYQKDEEFPVIPCNSFDLFQITIHILKVYSSVKLLICN